MIVCRCKGVEGKLAAPSGAGGAEGPRQRGAAIEADSSGSTLTSISALSISGMRNETACRFLENCVIGSWIAQQRRAFPGRRATTVRMSPDTHQSSRLSPSSASIAEGERRTGVSQTSCSLQLRTSAAKLSVPAPQIAVVPSASFKRSLPNLPSLQFGYILATTTDDGNLIFPNWQHRSGLLSGLSSQIGG